MPTIKKVFVFLALCSLGVTLTPTTSLAGQCLCKDERSFFSKKAYCFDNINTANECSFLKSATNVTAIDPKTGESSSGPGFDSCEYFAKSCFLLATDNLDGAAYLSKVSTNETPCGSEICKKVTELPCTNNSECSTYLGICKNNFCYLPPAGLTRFQKTPGLTSVAADLQLKKPIFEVRIPGLKFTDIGEAIDAEGYLHIPYIGEFVSLIYKLAMGVGSIVALVMIITQGLKIVVSGGGDLQSEAYSRIGQIVIGLVILWGSYAILYTLNPELVQFRSLKVKYIEPQDMPEVKTDESSSEFDGVGAPSCQDANIIINSLDGFDERLSYEYNTIKSKLTPNMVANYKAAVKASNTNVPWQILATVHFKEAGMTSGKSILNGGAPCNTANDGDLLKWCPVCSNPTPQNDLICGAIKIKNKAGGADLTPANLTAVKTMFCKYNGCFTCPDAHPYVAANFDKNHTNIPKQIHDCVPQNCVAGATSDFTVNPPQRNKGCSITIFESSSHPNIGLNNYCMLNQAPSSCAQSQGNGKITYNYNNNKVSAANPCGSWTEQKRAGALGVYAKILKLENEGAF